MFENLSNKLDRAFKVLKGQGSITEVNVALTIKEIRRALIEADVSYKVAKEITSNIKEKAMGQNVLISVSPGQLLTKIVSDELAMLMGGNSADINDTGNPNIILLSGLLLLIFYFGFLVPYLDLLDFLSATPAGSRTPRITWYLTPGKSLTRPPSIKTIECSCKL